MFYNKKWQMLVMFNRKYDMTNFLEYSHCSDNNLDQNESDSKHVFSG